MSNFKQQRETNSEGCKLHQRENIATPSDLSAYMKYMPRQLNDEIQFYLSPYTDVARIDFIQQNLFSHFQIANCHTGFSTTKINSNAYLWYAIHKRLSDQIQCFKPESNKMNKIPSSSSRYPKFVNKLS